MNILILAAGYATRLYPLTQTKAKPLLGVAGKPMMEWVIDNLAPIPGISKVFVVTNNKFAADFQAWADGYNQSHAKLPFTIVNDGSTSDADKLGAIGDLHHVVQKFGIEDEDLLVVAGDNLFSESLEKFAEHARVKGMPVLGVYDVKSLDEAKKYGVVAVDGKGVISQFVEKPSNPPSTLIGIALYFYPKHVVPMIAQYLAAGNNPDQPGRFVQWLYPQTPVHAWSVPGTWFDVGSKENLEEANRVFAKFVADRLLWDRKLGQATPHELTLEGTRNSAMIWFPPMKPKASSPAPTTPTPHSPPPEQARAVPAIARRDAIKTAFAAAGLSAIAFEPVRAAEAPKPDPRRASPKRYDMLKSINQWAFPYPDRMSLRECMQLAKDAGFDGIELNYDLDNDLSPKSGTKEYEAIRRMADQIGIRISGLCSFLFWPYPLTSNDPAKRERSLELAGKIAQAAHDLGVENVLVVPGAVHIPWRTDHEPVPNDVCDQRAREAVGKLATQAEKLKVSLNIENIFFNGYLMTPMEMNAFVDGIGSEHVRVHFDTGNISMFQHAEHWVPILGKRTKNIHLKEFTKKGTDYSLETFRPLLDGTTNWPAVTEALDKVGYRGFVTFEYFHPYPHYPEALIFQTSDSLDRILGRKS